MYARGMWTRLLSKKTPGRQVGGGRPLCVRAGPRKSDGCVPKLAQAYVQVQLEGLTGLSLDELVCSPTPHSAFYRSAPIAAWCSLYARTARVTHHGAVAHPFGKGGPRVFRQRR